MIRMAEGAFAKDRLERQGKGPIDMTAPTEKVLEDAQHMQSELRNLKKSRYLLLGRVLKLSSRGKGFGLLALSIDDSEFLDMAQMAAGKQFLAEKEANKLLKLAYRMRKTAERNLQKATEAEDAAKKAMLEELQRSGQFMEGNKAVSEKSEQIERKMRGIGKHKIHH